MLAYMAARAVARRMGVAVRFNAGLPEWGVDFNPALHADMAADPGICKFTDADAATPEDMAARIAVSGARGAVFHGFFQRYNLLGEAAFHRASFPLQALDIEPFAPDELVINIRAGELLKGHISWYPLVPPGFYKTLVEHTGLRPVLLGQLDKSPYMRAVLRACPHARLLPSAGPMVDFNRLRHAQNLCVAVSTFSWVAAWLSQAQHIHYPLLGFLHPLCITRGWDGTGGIDLTPLGDERYAYHLLPILNAAPQAEYLRHVGAFDPPSMPVSAVFAAGLSAMARFVPGAVDNLAGRARHYVRRYKEAAWSLALGQFGTARAHYEQVGQRSGLEYAPMEKHAWRHERPNLALGKAAAQSSVSEWSRGITAEEDAAGAVDGGIDEGFGFHTALEDAPWWRVDLGAACLIAEIWLFNRIEREDVAMRAAMLAIDVGADEESYGEVFRYDSETPFGGADGLPLIVRFKAPRVGRFVRVRLLRSNYLHLRQVEVYGVSSAPRA